MDEFSAFILGCLFLLGIPAIAVWFAVWVHRRLKKVETALFSLDSAVAELRKRVAALTTPAETPPERPAVVVAEPEPPAAPVEPEPAPVEPVPEPAVAAEEPAAAPEPPPQPPAPIVEEVRVPPWKGLEEKIGARLPVWLGAVALALSVAFLVKFSIDQGMLTETVRVTLGVLTGIALLVGGEWLRRKSAYVAQGLSAAGVAALFVAFFAAVSLYKLIPAPLGFVLMALTTAVAVLLSLRQGIIVATVGLVGGFLTPALVSGTIKTPALLFAYLLLLQLGLVAVTRKRRWWILGSLTLVAGLVWTFFYLAGPYGHGDAVWVGLFLLASVGAFLSSVFLGGPEGGWGNVVIATGLGWGAMGGGLIATGALAAAGEFGSLEWLFLGMLSLGCLVLARWQETPSRATYHGLAWLSAAVVAVLLTAWMTDLKSRDDLRFFCTVTLLGLLFAVGAYLAHRRSTRAGRWAALASSVGVVYLLIAFGGGRELGLEEFHWGVVALVLAVAYVAAAVPVAERRRQDPDAARPLAALAVGATTLISLAVPMELERQWLTVAWGAEVLALVWLAERIDVGTLRKVAWVMLAFVGVRLLVNPEVLDYPIGRLPVLNWFLYGYGIPIAAFAAAAPLAARQGDGKLSQALQWVTMALATALVTLDIRHYFHRDHLDAGTFYMVEWGTYVIAGLLLALAVLAAARRWPTPPLEWGARVLVGGSVAVAALTLGLIDNPLWSHQEVGTALVFNRLLWSYGIPIVLLVVAARQLAARGSRYLPTVATITALVALFLLVTLEVRQGFHGLYLDHGGLSNAENYTYSFAWILLGTVLIIAGIARRSRMLRYASLVVMAPAIVKVFFYDTRHLEGLYRALSLFALGVSCILLSFLYQRFLFRQETVPENPSEESHE
ncbi:MAG: DUF2339 domain-containing protein [bacterium]|nr:DUF2339 domain-containing protein [bacterium]